MTLLAYQQFLLTWVSLHRSQTYRRVLYTFYNIITHWGHSWLFPKNICDKIKIKAQLVPFAWAAGCISRPLLADRQCSGPCHMTPDSIALSLPHYSHNRVDDRDLKHNSISQVKEKLRQPLYSASETLPVRAKKNSAGNREMPNGIKRYGWYFLGSDNRWSCMAHLFRDALWILMQITFLIFLLMSADPLVILDFLFWLILRWL